MAFTVEDVRRGLSKKATFARSLVALEKLLIANDAVSSCDDLWELVHRSFVILKTRYNNPAFWRLGAQLYQAAKHACTADTTLQARLDMYLDDCRVHTEDHQPQRPPLPASAEPFLFEGQLSQEGSIPSRPTTLDEALLALRQTLSTNDGPDAEEQAQLLEALTAALTTRLADLNQEAVPTTAPPASKRALKQLRRLLLTPSDVEALGPQGVMCAICREELVAGSEAQIMPCNVAHAFHPPCLAPWLAQHNSCPVCRHELPTDDMRYEERKERAAEEAEDAKGRANALSHNEFMIT